MGEPIRLRFRTGMYPHLDRPALPGLNRENSSVYRAGSGSLLDSGNISTVACEPSPISGSHDPALLRPGSVIH